MNVPSPGSNFNFRKIEPKLTTPKPKAAIQQQAAPQASSVSSGNKLSSVAAMTTLKRGDLSVDQAQTTPSDESTETSTDDKSILEDTAESNRFSKTLPNGQMIQVILLMIMN